MRKIILTLALLCPFIFKAQTIEKSKIIGVWKVVDGKASMQNLPQEAVQMMPMLIDSFKESEWTFEDNGTFRLKFNGNLSPMLEDMKFLDNKLWKISDSQKIRIGTKEDNYNHLVLSVQQLDAVMVIYFSDVPISLSLKKV
ncbi:hypothetical protein [Flammeovirga sp. OC4]|uniref:hypothetical protein n=1 Tax=Flammeovirga sp. OC4 TaxID=1382345 RepID=UPI0005C49D92|nr:hypothetical protein [Flammeovirga sp. OC4]